MKIQLRYFVRDPQGAIVAEAETFDGARSAVVHISNESDQEPGDFRIHERAHPLDRVRFVDGDAS